MYTEVEFIEFIIKGLVVNPDSVRIERIEDELWVLLNVRVAKDDMWIIIWKQGNTINSLRSIIRILWVKLDKKINIKVLD